MKSKNVDILKSIGLHLLFWLGFIAYQMITLGWMNEDVVSINTDVQLITSIPTAIVLCYVNLYVFLPNLYDRQKYLAYAAAVILLIIAGGLLDRAYPHFIWRSWDRLHFRERYLLKRRSTLIFSSIH